MANNKVIFGDDVIMDITDTTALADNAAASTGNFALFAGGNYDYTDYTTVDTYNSSLTHSTAASLNSARSGASGASIANYAIIAGGDWYQISDDTYVSTAEAYNKSLTRSSAPNMHAATYNPAAVTLGNYALFAGGWREGPGGDIDAYYESEPGIFIHIPDTYIYL